MTDQDSPGTPENQYRLRQEVGDGRRTITIKLPRGWARAALSGIEAALLGWGVPTLFAVSGLLAIGTNPWLQDINLSNAASLGTDFWVLSLGGAISIDGLPISLIPLLWSLLQVLILRGLLVSGKGYSAAAQWMAVPTYVLVSALALLASPSTMPVSAILAGSLVISVISAGWAFITQVEEWPDWINRLQVVWSGVGTGSLWAFTVLCLGSLAFLGVGASNWSEISQVPQDLGAGGFSGVVLMATQIAYLPTYAAWILAWVSGAGFTFIGGQVLTPGVTFEGTLPALPVAQLIPRTELDARLVWLLVMLGIALGAITAWRMRSQTLSRTALQAAVGLAWFSALIGIWFALATGSLGSENLSDLGPATNAWPLTVLYIGGCAFAVTLLAHPGSFAWAKTVVLTTKGSFLAVKSDQDKADVTRPVESPDMELRSEDPLAPSTEE